jgi:hypothetical protein
MAAKLTPAGFTAKFLTMSPRSWLRRLLHRREPTMYQRCLAVHIHHAKPHSALS